MNNIHQHMDVEDLERYSMGASSTEEAAPIEEHLLICEDCRDRLRETDEYLVGIRRASIRWRRDERVDKRRLWIFPGWFPALAAVACGLLLVLVTLRLGRSPGPVAVSLATLRSNGAGGIAPAGRELNLHPDLTGLVDRASYRLEIVDQAGRPVRQGTLARAQNGIKVQGLGPGLYFVRVYLPAGELLREYGLQIR